MYSGNICKKIKSINKFLIYYTKLIIVNITIPPLPSPIIKIVANDEYLQLRYLDKVAKCYYSLVVNGNRQIGI